MHDLGAEGKIFRLIGSTPGMERRPTERREDNPGVTPQKKQKGLHFCKPLFYLVRPERFELPTPWFVAKYSIQLSYGRFAKAALYVNCRHHAMAEREGFEPSVRL